jgi:prepilin-type N-terminal cleavage/methylation domain-containing protein
VAVKRNSHAFTLIEMLGVIAVILILASMILATAKYARNKAMRTKTEAKMALALQEATRYRSDNEKYPQYLSDLPSFGNGMARLDAWNQNLLFRRLNDREFVIGSLGPDMRPGKARVDDDRPDMLHPYRSNGVDVTIWTELGYGDDIVGGDSTIRIRFAP